MPRKNLTELAVQQLNPQEKQIEYFDQNFNPGVSGSFGLRVSAKGKKTWFVSYRLKDDLRQIKQKFNIGAFPSMGLKEARKEAASLLTKVDAGSNPKMARQAKRQEPTFRDIAEIYLKFHAKRHKRQSSIKEDNRIIDKELLPVWKNLKAKSIKRRDVITLLDSITERGPVMANRVKALLSTIFNVAIDRELVEVNPCYRLKSPGGKEKSRERVLGKEEIKSIYNSLVHITPIMGAIFKVRLLTAQRGAEVLSMRWEDIDLDKAIWTIPETVTKNKQTHRVPLTKPVIDILKDIPLKNEWVFPTRNAMASTQHISNTQKAFAVIKDKSGVSEFVLHDLRRTAASMMAEMGISEFDIGKVLNHTNESITAIYNRHSYDREKRIALERWAEKLNLIIYGKKAKVLEISRKQN